MVYTYVYVHQAAVPKADRIRHSQYKKCTNSLQYGSSIHIESEVWVTYISYEYPQLGHSKRKELAKPKYYYIHTHTLHTRISAILSHVQPHTRIQTLSVVSVVFV